MNTKIIELNIPEITLNKTKNLSEYPWNNFVERVNNLVEDYWNNKRLLILFNDIFSSEIKWLESKMKLFSTRRERVSFLSNFEERISSFLEDNVWMNHFYFWDNLMKKILADIEFDKDYSLIFYFIDRFKVFLQEVDLDKIPNIPKSSLYSSTINWVLFAYLENDKIDFKFEYLIWDKYYKEYKNKSLFYNLLEENSRKTRLLNKKEFINQNNSAFWWKYFDLIQEWIFNILDLVKRNKNIVFWELFYENKILENFNFSNEELLVEIYDFLKEFEDIFISDTKLDILYKVLLSITEDTYKKSFLDIEKEIDSKLDINYLKKIKEELYNFVNEIKSLT